MDLGSGLGHLTYSTLVHPGDDWPQMWDSLINYVPKVKEPRSHVATDGAACPLALGGSSGPRSRGAAGDMST